MFTSTLSSLVLLALAPIITAQVYNPHTPHPEALVARRSLSDTHRRFRRKGGKSPTNLAPGSLSASEGCTSWVRPVSGDSCYSVIADVGISLEEFYKLNEGLDDKCFNLMAGYDYCTKKKTSSASKSGVKKVVKTKAVKVASPSASATDDEGDCVAITTPATLATITASSSLSTTTSKPKATKTRSKPKAKAAATSAATAALAASTGSSSSSTDTSALSEAGVTSFLGTNTGIGSWFHTDSSTDSTNGHSWCGFPYNDAVPGFAPSVGTMLKNFGNDYTKAATAYCGLEAEVCNGSNCMTLVIADGFDDTWVLTPGSIDIVYDSFSTLFGKTTTNKDDVIKGVTWKLTGARNEQYKFKGQGSG